MIPAISDNAIPPANAHPLNPMRVIMRAGSDDNSAINNFIVIVNNQIGSRFLMTLSLIFITLKSLRVLPADSNI